MLKPARLFISYSQDSEELKAAVRQLALRLHRAGYEVFLDQFLTSTDPEDPKIDPRGRPFPMMLEEELLRADYVLVVWSDGYRRKVDRNVPDEIGHGVKFESNLVYHRYYSRGAKHGIIPVLLQGASRENITDTFQGLLSYQPETQQEFDSLLRYLGGEAKPASKGNLLSLPQRRLLRFAGRADVLDELHAKLSDPAGGAVHAIVAMGGMGKTQVALQYADRFRMDYQAVLWFQANSEASLDESFANVARALKLEFDPNDQEGLVEAVLDWLARYTGWLVVLDDLEDPYLAAPFIDRGRYGKVLVTTKSQSTTWELPMASVTRLAGLPVEEALDLFRKARSVSELAPADAAAAEALVKELGGWPLAIEQAASFIAASGCTVKDYLDSYRSERAGATARRDAMEAVDRSLRVSLRKVRETNPASGDLLSAVAFLAPGSVPRCFLTYGYPELGPNLAAALDGAEFDPLRLFGVLGPLTSLSLLQAHPDHLEISPVVQELERHAFSAEERRLWSERVVNAWSLACDGIDLDQPALCDTLLPHWMRALQSAREQGIANDRAARFFWRTAEALRSHRRFRGALPLMEFAAAMAESIDTDPAFVGQALNDLGHLHHELGHTDLSHQTYQRTLAWRETHDGEISHGVAQTCNNIAELYRTQGESEKADPLFRRALEVWRQTSGNDSDDVASVLNNMALNGATMNRLGEALRQAQEAHRIWASLYGKDSVKTATAMNNIGFLLKRSGDLDSAENWLTRALETRELILEAGDFEIARTRFHLADVMFRQGRVGRAKPVFAEAYEAQLRALGPEHPHTKESLDYLRKFE